MKNQTEDIKKEKNLSMIKKEETRMIEQRSNTKSKKNIERGRKKEQKKNT